MSTGAPNLERLRSEAIERRRIEGAELINSRKRKISELYTVSNLSRIRDINQDDQMKPIKDSLLGFLERNDLQKGHEFDLKTLQQPLIDNGPLPKQQRQDIPTNNQSSIPVHPSSQPQSQPTSQSPINLKPVVANNQQQVPKHIDTTPQTPSSQQTQIPNKSIPDNQVKQSQALQGTSISGIPQVQAQTSQSSSSQSQPKQVQPQSVPTSVPTSAPQSQPANVSSSTSVPDTLQKQKLSTPQSQSQVKDIEQTQSNQQLQNQQEHDKKDQIQTEVQNKSIQPSVQPSQSSSNQSQTQNQTASTASTVSKDSKQTQGTSNNRTNVIRKRNLEDKVSLYDPKNKEAIDTHVIFLKEQLPAKIAEATSLAELYYLAQTLPLVKLMPSTHKAVTSTMYETALTEGKINVVHSRIEELKRQGKWSLKQPTRFVDPIKNKQKTHWDHLLSEMNWMAIDFREERKLRIATCAFIAQSVSDYWTYGKVCCINRKPIVHLDNVIDDSNDDDIPDASANEISEDQEIDSIDISKLLKRPNPNEDIKPVKLPELTLKDFKKIKQEDSPSPFKLNLTTDELNDQNRTLLDEMPVFQSFDKYDDKYDELPLIPVSKSLIPIEDDSWYNVLFKQITDDSNYTPPQQKGLFGFSSQKRINTSIKPPSPPSLKYLDLRTPTIWLPEDDQNLIEHVNKFSFNWGVVSAHLSKKPTRSYVSNIERRTPWQCFERYIQLNDTFQINDMRGQNFMSATKWLEHAHNIQATTKRRISPLGVGVDSIQRGHKRLRWASMFEAIRKCMRKRESVTRPNNNQVRKGADDKKLTAPTPAELSKLKFERDKAIQEAYMQNSGNGFRTRLPAQGPNVAAAAAAAAASARPDNHQATSMPAGNSNGLPVPRPASQSSVQSQNGQQIPQRYNDAINRPSSTPSVPQQGQVTQPQQQQVPQQAQRSGIPVANSNPGLNNTAAVAAAQRIIQGQSNGQKIIGPNGTPYTPEQLQQLMQLRQRKLKQQQQAQQQAQQAQTVQGQTQQAPINQTLPQSQPRMNSNGISQVSPSPNLGNTQLSTGTSVNSPAMNNASRSNSNPQGSNVSSPLIGQSQPQQATNTNSNNNGNVRPSFVPAHVSAIINQIQSQNPNMSKQEVTKVAAQYLANLQAKQYRANAMNGNNGNNLGSSPVPNNSAPVNQSRPASNQASPSGFSQAKVNASVPTPQQILQQQGVSSSPPLQSPRIQQQAQPQQQAVRQTSNPNSPQMPLQQTNQSSSLTPQQKAQLDMLKVLHAEQQQKRQQQQQQQQAQLRNGQQGPQVHQQQVNNKTGSQVQNPQQSPNNQQK
ncbi:hypothetical protein BN7_5074 [Wickerhamomyces ciferrii]|uniref:Chromatin modification-related protein EAF1 n=1 Tax=Wickerhamomyces ciferrii (strain ATCC 14091 / BCRC 22168 / CBS 111 / JCM 3599 / NBRC 0793 / NRRL Y-1031 F-60-10) TaxID=1206466 RepID=K0KTZ3_WICCF|nr:uncharacterized protein BN7_5074 [Wickerhamomyces ciferrii]CCH45492.1 hypothetical protein BN7_5074 [Wickerhamomyces ciferrii]